MASVRSGIKNMPYADTNYLTGFFLEASRGSTKKEFENYANGAKAVPVEQGFLDHPDKAQNAILVWNATGRDGSVVSDDTKLTNPRAGNERFNEKEEAGMILRAGESSHFAVPPDNYYVWIRSRKNGEFGSPIYTSGRAINLSTLTNRLFTIYRLGTNGDTKSVIRDENISAHTEFHMLADGCKVDIEVGRSRQAYPPSEEQMLEEKRSRKPDYGIVPYQRATLVAGEKFVVNSFPLMYNIRFLHLNGNDTNGPFAGLGKVMARSNVPDQDNYVESISQAASAGTVVVFFKAEGDQDGFDVGVYPYPEVKPVSGSISITYPVENLGIAAAAA